jgi:anti-sigma regulatory factor (Ser/Thr protein kinase)
MYAYGKHLRHEPVALDIAAYGESVRTVEVNSSGAALPALQKIEDWMRVLGYSHGDLVAVLLAVREALANAILHGNGGDPSKQVRLKYLVTSSEVLVEVQDEGVGFDASCVAGSLPDSPGPRSGGRGLFLMRSYTDWMSFNGSGNRVTFCRKRRGM